MTEWTKLAQRPRGWKRELAAAAAVGAFLGAIGPFGSYSASPAAARIGYWIASAVLGTLIFGTAVRIVAGRRLTHASAVALVVIAAALLSLPFALIVAVPAHAIWPRTAEIPFLAWYLQVLTVSAPLCAAWVLFARRTTSDASSDRVPPLQPSPLGVEPREVLCLQMEDHYVRVHHERGSVLVLTTMRQAQETLRGVPGLQVHRSWWVAGRAVEEAMSDGRSVRLRLSNGLVVPVSRSAVATVRAAGWLQ